MSVQIISHFDVERLLRPTEDLHIFLILMKRSIVCEIASRRLYGELVADQV